MEWCIFLHMFTHATTVTPEGSCYNPPLLGTTGNRIESYQRRTLLLKEGGRRAVRQAPV